MATKMSPEEEAFFKDFSPMRSKPGRKKGYSPLQAQETIEDGEDDSEKSEATRASIRKYMADVDHVVTKSESAKLALEIKRGLYVEKAAVEQVSAELLLQLTQALRTLPDNLERRFNLDPMVAEEITKVIDNALNEIADGFEMFTSGVK